MNTVPLLEAKGLGIERGGRQLFSGLTLSVCPGEIVHLRGANGTGKTSLLRILAGLARYGFTGVVNTATPALFLGHHSAVKSVLTPRENLCWHPSGEHFDDVDAVDAALEAVGLFGFEDVPTGMLSAGQQRRVNLARLYLTGKILWLLDEPFAAIDLKGVGKLQSRFAQHATAGGAVLLTSHQALEGCGSVRFVDLDETSAISDVAEPGR